jgi:hypothetical protein
LNKAIPLAILLTTIAACLQPEPRKETSNEPENIAPSNPNLVPSELQAGAKQAVPSATSAPKNDDVARVATNPAGATDGEIRLPSVTHSDVGDGAALMGKLAEQENCLYVEASNVKTLIVSSNKNLFWDEKLRRLVFNKEQLKVGDSVVAGGSLVTSELPPDAWVMLPGSNCDKRKMWLAQSISKR